MHCAGLAYLPVSRKIKGVIFDLDGVLCRTDRLHFAAWQVFCRRHRLPFSEALNKKLLGRSRMESLKIILGDRAGEYSPAELVRLGDEKNALYRALLLKMAPADLPEESRRVLPALRARGLLLAVGSSSQNTALILERLGLSDYFDAVADGTMITRAKPDPEVFLLAARLLGLAPSEALVAEDAAAGIEAAAAGGFPSAGLGEAAKSPLVTHPLETLSDLLCLPELQ